MKTELANYLNAETEKLKVKQRAEKTNTPKWYGKDGDIIEEGTGRTVALIPYFSAKYGDDAKNQKLIAAAPEMLDFCEWVINEIETTPDELSDALLGLIKIKARKTILKATT